LNRSAITFTDGTAQIYIFYFIFFSCSKLKQFRLELSWTNCFTTQQTCSRSGVHSKQACS